MITEKSLLSEALPPDSSFAMLTRNHPPRVSRALLGGGTRETAVAAVGKSVGAVLGGLEAKP